MLRFTREPKNWVGAVTVIRSGEAGPTIPTITLSSRSLFSAWRTFAPDPLLRPAMTAATAPAPIDRPELRTFAAIVCKECLYLEFPGCDVHGLLYTEPVHEGGELHAKCPKCSAATHNQRPFREGCRRCKGKTSITMWNSSGNEIAQAFRFFPSRVEEIDHAVLQCEARGCASVVFPSSREVLTTRTPAAPIVTSTQRVLKVSNFQLSMPHIAGCPRQGMPLHTMAVRLPKSELKFVLERIDMCPLPTILCAGPTYRKRILAPPQDTNQLHQIYLCVLTTILKTFDNNSPAALEPLKQIGLVFAKSDVMSIFHDWAPPSDVPRTEIHPQRSVCTARGDDAHGAACVVDPGLTYWKVECAPGQSASIELVFEPPISVSAIALRWHAQRYVCATYTLYASTDKGRTYEAIASVAKPMLEHRVTLASALENASHVKLVVDNSTDSTVSFGLESFGVYDTKVEVLYTPPNQLLQDLLKWIATATASTIPSIRVLALQLLQQVALMSGSLCGLLHVVKSMLVAAETELDVDETIGFVSQLSQSIQKTMLRSNASADHARLEKRIITQMSMSLQDEVTRRTIQILQNIPGLEVYSPQQASTPEPATPLVSSSSVRPPEVVGPKDHEMVRSDAEPSLQQYPVLVLLLCQHSFSKSIRTRTELSMVLLSVLSELSVWQMQRMQKPEVFVGRREDELRRLEDPFSMQVCPELFDVCHDLLQTILAPWLAPEDATRLALHAQLTEASATFQRSLAASPSNALEQPFNPITMGLAVLQVITANVRRLVLSQVNPVDVGLGVLDDDGVDQPLVPMIASLEKLIGLGTKQSDPLFALSLQAAAAVEVGMEAFYPSSQQRTALLTNRMGSGATLEFQLRWPVQEREQEDPRYERLILLLQLVCIKHGYVHALRGQWGVFLHLVLQVPDAQSTSDVLTQPIAECIAQAGFASWRVVAGAQEISITLQRHLHWNRVEKMSHDSGSGWIRVYPRDVAAFSDVLAEVEAFASTPTLKKS
ncbi:hypothetical protein SDRG_03819 [Saprolegnia diclina VS20]|uniref:F5/8 type C domain-containing protein n=1 Tax=Saprolegnia diclina (strain VS20) TaxID=1156394 RepID=T0QW07_SAPDV|nr:hypothetical protein SDRG_03819 [Saprolegnia diclina VS20]EQC38861.1 hypothetical protein SDRG_03819 [Saprolegnia diclina VS20]|eukprot:XP_008607685.1 hypothetical protein SDRG_03819 [Saprolegnia diclina VS20]